MLGKGEKRPDRGKEWISVSAQKGDKTAKRLLDASRHCSELPFEQGFDCGVWTHWFPAGEGWDNVALFALMILDSAEKQAFTLPEEFDKSSRSLSCLSTYDKTILEINKTYQTYPFALTVGSLLNAMDSKWNRDQNPKGFDHWWEQLSDFSVSELDESYEVNFLLDSRRMRFQLPEGF